MLLQKHERKHVYFTITILFIYLTITYFSSTLEKLYNPQNHLSFHVLLEMFIIIIAFAIALLAWTIFRESLSAHRLYLGSLFYVVAILEMWHMLTYNGMPFFMMESSIPRATWFWLLARLTEAVGLLAIFLMKDQPIHSSYRKMVFLLANLYLVITVLVIETQINLLPTLVVEGQGTTTFKNALEYVVIFLLMCTIVVLLTRYRKDKQLATLYIISALELFILSEFTFTLYQSVNDVTNMLGHAYKVIGVYFLYKGIYVTTIEEPYQKRKQAEQSLKESEQRYRSLVDVSPDAIVVHYHNKILYCNQNFKELVEEDRDLVGTTILSYLSDEDEETFQSQVLSMGEHGTYGPSERRYITATGKEVYVEVKAASIRFQGKDAIIANVRNISDRKQLEWQIEESEMRYKSLFDYNQNASFVLDMEGHFVNGNHAAERTLGYSKKELIGSSWIPLVKKSELPKTTEHFSKVMEGSAANFETIIMSKEGREVHLYINAAPIIVKNEITGVIGVAQDVTQQKLAEKELKESEERYRQLIELYPDGLYVHDHDQILYVNDRAVELLGGENKQQILKKSIIDFLPDEKQHEIRLKLKTILYEGYPSPKSTEIEFITLTGEKIIAEIGTARITYNGKSALLVSFRDITKRKEQEEKLQKANQLLRNFSNVDGLTGVYNRRYFDQTLETEWERAHRYGRSVSLIMVDIDQFKNYNDTYGHLQGDECLKMVTKTIQTCLQRPTDVLARYGGEEFAIILPETNQQGACYIGERVRKEINSQNIPHESSEIKTNVTVSIGIATLIPSDDLSPTNLIEMADVALYKAKNRGKNRVEEYTLSGKMPGIDQYLRDVDLSK
ncbi:sensor domain-containing diguanylate cyclase [Aquibacillus sediminis]|uniref:sensor domain-containing diguanylate cyclase n=1 Tax=Aquibacillus sediminis TaxID=2574734 RepID=UPI001486CC91|nr:MASE3 domain-containing protein [Aquibacillus sediminis]